MARAKVVVGCAASLGMAACIVGGAPAAPTPIVEDAAASGPRIAAASVEAIPGDQQLLEPKRRVIRVYASLDKPGPARAYFRCEVGPTFGSASATISDLLRDSYTEITIPMSQEPLQGRVRVSCEIELKGGEAHRIAKTLTLDPPTIPDDRFASEPHKPRSVFDCATNGPPVAGQTVCTSLSVRSSPGFAPEDVSAECQLDGKVVSTLLGRDQPDLRELGFLEAGRHMLRCSIEQRHQWERASNNQLELAFDVLTPADWNAQLQIASTHEAGFDTMQVVPGQKKRVNSIAFYVRVKNLGPQSLPRVDVTCNAGEFAGSWVGIAAKTRGQARPARFESLSPGQEVDVLVSATYSGVSDSDEVQGAVLPSGTVLTPLCVTTSPLPSSVVAPPQTLHVTLSD